MSDIVSQAEPAAEAIAEPSGKPGKLPLGAVAWAIFEGARNPYVILVTIYIFMPYLTGTVIGDSVKGQEIVSRWSTYASLVIMVTAPFLGAAIDKLGRRKGWMAAIVMLMAPMMFALWWTRPDGSAIPVIGALALTCLLNILFPYSEVVHNSLLVGAAGLRRAHKASSLALALGNGFAVTALFFTAWAFALPGNVDWSWVPHAPLFGLDPAQHEQQRIVGPLAAVIFVLGALPLFLFTPDVKSTGMPLVRAFREGAAELWRMVKAVKEHRDAAIFLAARMFYIDGMTAILLYAGIYATGVMKFDGLTMLFYGIILSVLAVIGGFIGGALDARLGPKRAVQLEIAMTFIGIVAFLGMGPDKILYLWHYDPAAHAPLWNGPFFTTLPQVIFLLIGFNNAIFITAHYASSRTLLTRLTPPAQTGTFFGVFALSGTATLWLGSLLVNLGTNIFHTQQGGFATITILLALGFLGLLFVKGGGRQT